MKDRIMFYYAPDEPIGGEGDFAPPGGDFAVVDVPAEGADAPEPQGDGLGDAPPVEGEYKPEESQEAKPTEKVAKVEGEPDEGEPVKAEETTEAKPVELGEPHIAALQSACDALGITETDPAKQLEAINAAKADIVARREQQATERETARVEKAEQQHAKVATQATHDEIMSQLKKGGWDLDRTPPPGKTLWDAETWADYDDPAAVKDALIQQYNDLRQTPTTKAFFAEQYHAAKTAYDTTQAKLTETSTKYAMHDPTVAAIMRDNNVPPELFETVARSTHEHTQKAIATTNSALVAANAELETLRTQISGYDAAIAKAKEEARAEALNEAVAQVNSGRTLPNTTGLGGTPNEAAGVKGIFDNPGEFSLAELVKEMSTSRR